MKSKISVTLAVAAISLLALFLAACGGGSGSDTTTDGNEKDASESDGVQQDGQSGDDGDGSNDSQKDNGGQSDRDGPQGPDLTGRWNQDGYDPISNPRYLDITFSSDLDEFDFYDFEDWGTNVFDVPLLVADGFLIYEYESGEVKLGGTRRVGELSLFGEQPCPINANLALNGNTLSGWVSCARDVDGARTLYGDKIDVSYTRSGTDSGGGGDDGGTVPGSGPSAPLYDGNVSAFIPAAVPWESQPAAAERELGEVDSGQQVMLCQYGPTNPDAQTGYVTYEFWYEDVPDNIDELLSVAGESGGPVPVSQLGRNSLDECPDIKAEGEAAWRRGR